GFGTTVGSTVAGGAGAAVASDPPAAALVGAGIAVRAAAAVGAGCALGSRAGVGTGALGWPPHAAKTIRLTSRSANRRGRLNASIVAPFCINTNGVSIVP